MTLTATNETSLSPTLRAYAKNTGSLSDSAVRITTGLRVLRIGDDTSSVSAAAPLQAQRAGIRGTLTNGARASSFLQVAYDGLDKIRSILESLDTLATDASGTGITTKQYAYFDAQFQSKLSEIDDVVAATTFDGASILDGSSSGSGATTTLIGEDEDSTITLDIPDVSSASLFASPVNVGSLANATTAATSVATAQDTIDEAIAKIDAYQLRLTIADAAAQDGIYAVTTGIDNLLNADADAEEASSNTTRLRQDTAAALVAQTRLLNSDLLRLVGALA